MNTTSTAVPHDIKAATIYIHNLLLSRGYVSRNDEILLSTQALTEDTASVSPDATTGGEGATNAFESNEIPSVTRFERAVDSDRRILELLNTLLETITSDEAAYQTHQAEIKVQKQALLKAEERLARLQIRYESLDASSSRQQQQLETTVRGLELENKTLKEELSKAKSALQSGREQFANELRRKDVDIASLKKELTPQKRIQPRSSTIGSTTTTTIAGTANMTGVTGIFSKAHNSYTIDARPSLSGSYSSIKTKLGNELDAAVGDVLVPTVRALAAENSMLVSLAYKTLLIVTALAEKGYVDPGTDLSAQELDNIEALGYDMLAMDSDVEDGQTKINHNNNISGRLRAAHTIQRTTQVERLGEKVLSSLGLLAAGLQRADMVPVAEVSQRDAEIAELRAQVTTITANWNQAIRTMEDWKTEFQRLG